MKPFPLPLRVAAGLAVSTAERVRELPRQLAGLPVTVVSQVLQASMRVQQHVTELAIKGDNALSGLRPVEDTPSWATFDEDSEPDLAPSRPNLVPVADVPEPRAEINGHLASLSDLADGPDDPWAEEERALAQDHADGEFDAAAETGPSPAGLVNYDELTLPQLRARLRRLSIPQLEEILEYEQVNANRASFTGMLSRRIGNARKTQEDAEQAGEAGSGDGTEGL
jgi:hypothetical protein